MDFESFNELCGRAIMVARHQDAIKRWPWYGQLIHRLLVSRWCPACKYWKAK